MEIVRIRAVRSERKAGPDHWSAAETRELLRVFATLRQRAGAEEYAYGLTELGEPQFYVLAPGCEEGCVACISRLRGGRYVLENGRGGIVAEGPLLAALVSGFLKSRARRPLLRVVNAIAGVWTFCTLSGESGGSAISGDDPLTETLLAWMPVLLAAA